MKRYSTSPGNSFVRFGMSYHGLSRRDGYRGGQRL